VPVDVRGPHREHVIAFARIRGRDAVVVAVGRLLAALSDGGRRWPPPQDWQAELVLDGFGSVRDTMAPARTWPNPAVPIANLFTVVPVALLRASLMHRGTGRRRAVDSPGEPVVAG
jgi:(1->4)-alpha-D-glucan 1-alpha-D-glucosylmutase